jgi:hypothetical protein
METTANERAAIRNVPGRVRALRAFVRDHEPPDHTAPAAAWFRYLAKLKAVQGNLHNLSSLPACLIAKDYLSARLPMAPFDVAQKPQAAPGLDIDAATSDGRRVIGELKTTVPYGVVRLGAAQHKAIATDIAKLRAKAADHKFLFVTDPQTKKAVERAFAADLHEIEVVCLVDSGHGSA